MRYMGGFEISLFPRYLGGLESPAALENILSQKAFWSALHLLAVCEHSTRVELRIVSRPEDGVVRIFVLFIGARLRDDIVRGLRYLLPKQFAYRLLEPTQLQKIVEPVTDGRGWHIADVSRRNQFMDLPNLVESKDDLRPRESASDMGNVLRLSFEGLEEDAERFIPEDLGEFRVRMAKTRYCLPLLGEMKEFVSDRRQLYEELQLFAPATISVVVHPFSKDDLNRDRQLATRFRALVDYFGNTLENSGFAQIESLRRAYDRYFLTNEYISLLTIRVAAKASEQATSIAYQLCSWLGGTKAFVVSPTYQQIGLHTLSDISAALPEEGGSAWHEKVRELEERLADEDINLIEGDDRYYPFLIRLPHVYTIDEASLLLRLPISQEQGIPGLKTRMLPPFSASSQRYDPVIEGDKFRPASGDRIRIGRINPASSLPADGDDSALHWHSIPLRDLVKHALVVGSTGSGKTVTTLFLMRELLRLEVPFLIIEPVKTEYYDALRVIPGVCEGERPLRRLNFEGTKTAECSRDYLSFDPMRLQEGVTVARHISYLKTCFEAAFPMEPWQALLLENAMREYYLTPGVGCGFKLFTRGGDHCFRVNWVKGGKAYEVFPGFATFSRFFLDTYLVREFGDSKKDVKQDSKQKAPVSPSDHVEQMRQLFRRRFENLQGGPLGRAFRIADRDAANKQLRRQDFTRLLQSPTVIELDAVPDGEQKSLIMAFLMTFLFERRQADDLLERERANQPRPDPVQSEVANTESNRVPGSEELNRPVRHVLVIEEAHRLLANPEGNKRGDLAGAGAQAKAVSLFVDMLAEIRAFKQSLIIVEQIPTKLVPAAVKNTNLKIMLRITSREDRDYLGEAMNFNEEQKKFVSSLRAEAPTPPLEQDGSIGDPGQVQFVAFDENYEQPLLLTLPLRASTTSTRWFFDEYFSDGVMSTHARTSNE